MSQSDLFVDQGIRLDPFTQPVREADDSTQVVVGRVARFLFINEGSGHGAGVLVATDGATEMRFRGNQVAHIRPGSMVRFEGQWSVHPSHGRQFLVEQVRSELPVNADGVLAYITENLPGCGKTRAARIVDHFGPGVLGILSENPERIAEVFPAGKLHETMLKGWTLWAGEYQAEKVAEEVNVRLSGAGGITPRVARGIVSRFGPSKALDVVLHRPYDLCQVRGIGFTKADSIARAGGIQADDPARIAAGVVHVMEMAMSQGHSCLPAEMLERRAVQALEGIPAEAVRIAIAANLNSGTLLEREGMILTPLVGRLEERIAGLIGYMARRGEDVEAPLDPRVEEILLEDDLTEDQAAAVRRALRSGVFILTGRPGAGKTTTMKSLLRAIAAQGDRNCVAVCAPSGKAASRAAEVTGWPATTIHRLMGVRFPEDRKSPLPHRWIILDETSLCDLETFDWFVRNIDPSRTSLVIVGDADQLPSVGHGQVLRDLLRSETVPKATLTKVFRQGDGSLIKANANRLLDGLPLDLTNPAGSDFLFADVTIETRGADGFPIEDPDQSKKECALARRRLEGALRYLMAQGVDPHTDIQVMSPMLGRSLGVIEVNRLVQEVVNPNGEPGPFLGDGLQVREGDRVIQVKNDYDRGVFNGDQGIVRSVNPRKASIEIDFGERVHLYSQEDLKRINLSWAITVHRSQGSEFAHCILLYHTSHFMMLDPSLLYTAITRGRKQLIIIGNKEALSQTSIRGRRNMRHTGLADRLRQIRVVDAPFPPSAG